MWRRRLRVAVVCLTARVAATFAGCTGNSYGTTTATPHTDFGQGLASKVSATPTLNPLDDPTVIVALVGRLDRLGPGPLTFTDYDAAQRVVGFPLLRPAGPFESPLGTGHVFPEPRVLAQTFEKPGGDALRFEQGPATAVPVPASALVRSPNPVRSKWIGPYYVTLWASADTGFERFETGARYQGQPAVGLVTGAPKDVDLMDEFVASLSFADGKN